MIVRLTKLLARSAGVTAALASCFASSSGIAQESASAAQPAQRPNILLIVADDLGYSDLGAFGGEIRTPNLDALAKSGVRFTNFHTGPQCTVTRSMMLSGTDNHLVGFGGSAEIPDRAQQGHPGYEGYLNDRAASIAEQLHRGGYYTVMSGKWHLGARPQSDPSARGFERSFVMVPGAANHFGKAPWVGSLANTYRVGEAADPHWPLQAPAEDIARYKGRYDAGWGPIRAERVTRQRALGLMVPGERAHDPVPPARSWEQLSPQDRAIEARKMEVYAGMVDQLDQNVGRLVDYLKRSGKFNNTIFLFFADNGAEALAMEQSSIPENAARGRDILSHGDNRLENLGSATSLFWYGQGWGQVSSAPAFRNKHYATEGGTRVVAFASQPGAGASNGKAGLLSSGNISRAFINVYDIAPTLMDWAGLTRGDDGRLPFIGRSMVPYLAGRANAVHGPQDSFAIEFRARRSYHMGDWKIVLTPRPEGSGKWELYNVAHDPNETRDLAKRRPEVAKRLEAGWNDYAARYNVILPARPGM